MTARFQRGLAGAVGVALGAFVMAGSSLGQPPAPVPAPPGTPPYLKPFPDPTIPDLNFKDGLKGMAANPKNEPRIRGRVITKSKAAVILEIDGQTYLLPVGGEARSIRVKSITADEVTLEVGYTKDLKVLH